MAVLHKSGTVKSYIRLVPAPYIWHAKLAVRRLHDLLGYRGISLSGIGRIVSAATAAARLLVAIIIVIIVVTIIVRLLRFFLTSLLFGRLLGCCLQLLVKAA